MVVGVMLFDTFKDTIFLKESTELEKKCNALNKLKSTTLILPIKVKTHGEEIVKIIND